MRRFQLSRRPELGTHLFHLILAGAALVTVAPGLIAALPAASTLLTTVHTLVSTLIA